MTIRNESEDKYHSIIEKSADIIFRLDKNYRYIYVNPAISIYMDLKPEDFIGKTNRQLGTQSFNTALLEGIIRDVFDSRCQKETDIELEGRDGGKLYFSCQIIPELDNADAVNIVSVISRDITKRVELEHQLQEKGALLDELIERRTANLLRYNASLAEELIQRKEAEKQLMRERHLSDNVINTIPGILIIVDNSGRLLLWNKYLESVTEYSADEINAMNIIDLFPDDQKSAVQDELKDMFANRKDYYEHDLCNKSRTLIPFYIVGSVIDLDNKRCLTLIGVNITERKQMEDELVSSRERLRLNAIHLQNTIEEDRKNISRELHDDLGQSLTVLKYEIYDIVKSTGASNNNIINDKAKNIVVMVDNIIDSTHSLIMSLRPTILDDFGLIPAIEWQISELHKRTGTTFEFDVDNIKNRRYFDELNKEYSTTLYRVFQESVTNVVRHANAEKVSIKMYDEGDSIIMEVEDNGKGIDESLMFNYKSLGIIGMRERVSLLGGTLAIDKKDSGTGTKITVSIPAKNR
ncbi:MAG: PAS domain S-box protein [Nitrospirae bacterium]|nr:PAS domain S-box protein [Nitrospirota bacterium]